ncbi:MAG: type II toxin-antitoxin system Phd/YefM family antitoxin [Gemmatimonadaceae bacterium]
MIATTDIRPITHLKTATAEVVREVSEDGRTIVITQNGEAKAVIMGSAQYDEWRQAFALLKLLGQSRTQHREGKTRSTDEVFESVAAAVDAAERQQRQKEA